MKYLVIMLALVCACDDGDPDTDEVKALKVQCHDILKHIVSVTSKEDGEAVASALPIEDIEGCVASEPEIRACMLTTTDLAGVKKCVPSVAKLGCMQKASKAKKAAHDKAKQDKPDPVMDKPFDDIRARCWGGDEKAAEILDKKTI